MPDPFVFVGREEERERIHRVIGEQARSIICLSGRSGMGKTHLLGRVREELDNSPDLYSAHHQFRSPSEDPLFPFVASLGELVRAAETKEGMVDKARRLVQALGSEPKKTARRMAGAAYRAAREGILGKVKEYFQYEKIVEEAVCILEEKAQEAGKTAKLDELLAQARPAVITSYLGLLENLSDHADPDDRYVFAFDQMEHAPEGALDFLMTLVRELPPRCHLLFSLNIENPRGGDIWQETHSELRANAVEIVEVGPFRQEEIRQLIRARGQVVPPLDLLHEVERATGGRPLAVDDWIQSEDFARGRIGTDQRFQEYQVERLNACSRETRKIARALALIPKPFPRGIAEYAPVFQTSASDVEERLQELVRQHLFMRTGDQYWFVHEEIQETIRSEMAEAVRRELAQSLIAGLQAIDAEIMEKQTPYSLLAAALLPWTGDHEKTYTLNAAWARSLYSISETIGAWEHSQRALQAAEDLRDRPKQAHCFRWLAMISNLWGRPDRALDYYCQSLTIDREVGDRGGEATTLNNIGLVYADLGQKEKALELYAKALSIVREIGDRGVEAATLNNIGLVCSALGQNDKAMEFLQQALRIVREIGDRRGEATTLDNIGGVYADLGQNDKALRFHQQALRILREIGDRGGEVTTLNNIGGVYSALGQNDKALEFLQQALPVLREIGDRGGEAATLNNIGLVCSALGQKDKALEFYQEALPIRREVGDRGGEATTLNNIGFVYADLGQNDKALRFHQQALRILREIGDRGGEATTLNNIASIYFGEEKLAEAVSLMQQVVTIYEEIHHPELEDNRRILESLQHRLHAQ